MTPKDTVDSLIETARWLEAHGAKYWFIVLHHDFQHKTHANELKEVLKEHGGVPFASIIEGREGGVTGWLNDVSGVEDRREDFRQLLQFAVKNWKR